MHGGDTESAVTRSPHIWASTMVITRLIAYRSHLLFPVIRLDRAIKSPLVYAPTVSLRSRGQVHMPLRLMV